MKYIKKFIVILLAAISITIFKKNQSSAEVLDLSKIINEDVSESSLTLTILDNNCMSAYNNWLSLNVDIIGKTYVKQGIIIHSINKRDKEYVYVILVDQLNRFNVDVNSFKTNKSKLLVCGHNSVKATVNLRKKFNKTIDISHECQ